MRPPLALVAVAVLAVGGCAQADQRSAPAPAGATDPGGTTPRETASASPSRAADLLQPADHGDGDSWRDTAGREYRLGMVNAPELDECFGREASAERKALTEDGFRVQVYTDDRYGRGVSVVTTADGRNLNVHLARHGFVDDRYLADFRHENPELAAELAAAFAAAKSEGRGRLWSACAQASRSAAPGPEADAVPPLGAPAAAGGVCHPDDATCVPVQGSGSGQGGSNDVDCGDGTGCDS